MDESTKEKLCPRCSVPGGEQHRMKRMYINFTDRVDMCPNSKCQWVQLVSVDSGTDAQTQLPGGLPVTPETQLPGGLPAVPETRLPGGLSAGQDSQLPGGPSAVQDTQTRLPGGLTSVPGPASGGGDEFDRLLSSLCTPSVDSGVDVDCSDRSLSSWEPAASDAGSLCSELAGVGLSSVASVASEASEADGGSGWRPASLPAGPRSTVGLLPTGTRSEPDPAFLRREARRARLTDPRPQSGLSLRSFNYSESRQARLTGSGKTSSLSRPKKPTPQKGLYPCPSPAAAQTGDSVFRRPSLPPWERAALRHSLTGQSWQLVFGWDRAARRRHRESAVKKLERAERLDKELAAADLLRPVLPATRSNASPAATATSCTATVTSATSVPAAAAAAPAAPKTGPLPAAEPGRSRLCPPPTRHTKPRAASLTEVAARMDSALTSPELLSRLRSTFNTDQVYVRARQVERVRSWARKKTGAAGR